MSVTDEDVLANFGGKDGPELRKAAREAADYIIAKKFDAIEPIEWRTTEPEKPVGDVTIVLHMDDTLDGAVVLRFDAIRPRRLDASERYKSPQTEALPEIQPWEMYGSKDNSRDTNDQTSLRNSIVNHVIDHFDKGFQEAFRKAVLLMIPLVQDGKGIEIDNNRKQFAFILPVAWSMLRPLPKTFFCVTFYGPPRAGMTAGRHGTIYLAPSERYPKGGEFLVAAPIHECKIHPIDFLSAEDHTPSQAACSVDDWVDNHRLRELFSDSAVLKTVTVRLVSYDRERD